MTDQEFYDAVMAIENEHCDDCGEPLYLLPDWPKDKSHDCGLAHPRERQRQLLRLSI